MATYKVIQDIESEDKLLGPLTLRQFIYAVIVIVMGFVAFQLAQISPLLVIPFLPPIAFFGLLAAPFGHDQSSEVWLLAKIRFMLKPRLRIWDQSGMQELVTITAPKKIEHALTNGLSQTEVKSRLKALADTIDSRGWAVKNVNVNLSTQPSYLSNTAMGSDRLLDASSLPQDVPTYEVLATDDMMDEKNNLTAQHLDSMITQAEQTHRQNLMQSMQGTPPAPTQQNDYWFMHQTDQSNIPAGMATFGSTPTITPGTQMANPTSDDGAAEQALLEQIRRDKARPDPGRGHMKVIDPRGPQKPAAPVPQPVVAADPKKAAALAQLASRDDLNISTIAREAKKATDPDDGEVVISLR